MNQHWIASWYNEQQELLHEAFESGLAVIEGGIGQAEAKEVTDLFEDVPATLFFPEKTTSTESVGTLHFSFRPATLCTIRTQTFSWDFVVTFYSEAL